MSYPTYDYTFVSYETTALETADYPDKGKNAVYPAMGLSGEAGEACDKVKKLWRNLGTMNGHDFSQQAKTEIIKELGDVLWYITAVAQEIGSSLEAVALANKLKLTARREAGTIKSEGDNR